MLHFSAVLFSGLLAGLFFAYSCSVNPGLGQLPDSAYLQAMQNINRVILNPAFFTCFLGSVLLLALVSLQLWRQPAPSLVLGCSIAALLVNVIGVTGITMLGNVPLNEMLDKVDLAAATPEQLAEYRRMFEQPWNSFHFWRTVASVLSFGLITASVYFGRAVAINT